MLRMVLNSFFAISNQRYPNALIKGAFEWRAAVMSGYEPMLCGCSVCGAETGDNALYLDVMNGGVVCADCLRKKSNLPINEDEARNANLLCPLSPAALAALRYVATAPLARLFSFELSDGEDLRLFANAAETYLLSHVGHGFRTLDFYHEITGS